VPALREHLDAYVGHSPGAWLFRESEGWLSRGRFGIVLNKAKAAAGVEDATFHTLRHTGATWFTEQGATVREVMERLGHRSERTALRYQHAAAERMRSLAAGLGGRHSGNAQVAASEKPGKVVGVVEDVPSKGGEGQQP
jgi:site-specific recombinase XerD